MTRQTGRPGGVPRWLAYRWTAAGLKRRWFTLRRRSGVVVACRLPVYGPNPLNPTNDWRNVEIYVDGQPLFGVGGCVGRKARSQFVSVSNRAVRVAACVRTTGSTVHVDVPVRGQVVVVQVFGEAQSLDGTIIPAHAMVDGDQTDDS